MSLSLHARHRLDLSTGDFAHFALNCLRPPRRSEAEGSLQERWGGGAGLATLSVRSAFDLLLTALDLPVGSEILATAITIPDMVKVAQAHGLVVVPLDLSPETLLPAPGVFEHALTPRSRLVLAAHLFGGRLDLRPLAARCRAHGLMLVEDAAQGFLSPSDAGSRDADVSLFSFGMIKTATALGGGLVRVADPALRARMRALHAGWPLQDGTAYPRRLARCLAMAGLTHGAWRYGALATAMRGLGLGLELDAVVGRWAKGFPRTSDAELLLALRQRPSAALLGAMTHRLVHFDPQRLTQRAEVGEWVAGHLRPELSSVGSAVPTRTHWLFPVTTPNPSALAHRLREAGFDAAQGTTSIAAIPPPADRPELRPHRAEALLRQTLFVPVYPEIPAAELERLVGILDLQPQPSRAAPEDRLHVGRTAAVQHSG